MTFATLCLAPIPAGLSSGWRPEGWAHVLCRLLAALTAISIGWRAAAPVLMGRGGQAVRSFCWTADGLWRLELPDGRSEAAALTSATATLGPWILLAWLAETPGPGWRRLRYALLDVSDTGVPAFRLLSARLRLEAGRFRRRAPAFRPAAG